MCTAPATKASVLIVCCRKHCEPVAAYMHILTVMQRLKWRVRSIYMRGVLVRSHYCYWCSSSLDKQTEGSLAQEHTHTPGVYQCSAAAGRLVIIIIISIVR